MFVERYWTDSIFLSFNPFQLIIVKDVSLKTQSNRAKKRKHNINIYKRAVEVSEENKCLSLTTYKIKRHVWNPRLILQLLLIWRHLLMRSRFAHNIALSCDRSLPLTGSQQVLLFFWKSCLYLQCLSCVTDISICLIFFNIEFLWKIYTEKLMALHINHCKLILEQFFGCFLVFLWGCRKLKL